jgi:hypothetical protein
MLLAMAAATLLGIVGCGTGMPTTYPVRGKIVLKGGKPVTDGRVQFQSTTDPQIKALSDIEQDGSFSLTTYIEARNAAGAPAGTYRVVIELERPARVVAIPKEYTVEPHDNDFTIVIEKLQR